MKKIYIYSNDSELSKKTHEELSALLPRYDFVELSEYNRDVDLIACIGGDGTFLHFLHACDFPSCPIIGINTGHLGFFQEAVPGELEEFLSAYSSGEYTIQTVRPINAIVYTKAGIYEHSGINEIIIKGPHTRITQLRVDVDGTTVQEFSGDGILVSTSVGSTAYNYSLDGAIVAPELDVLQMTPIAPSNTNAYRCFHSSIIYPSSSMVTLYTMGKTLTDEIDIAYDGINSTYDSVIKVEIVQSDIAINLIRYNDYGYWAKLKDKLL